MRKNLLKFGIILFVLTLLVLTPRENSLSVKQKEYNDPNDNVEISTSEVADGKFRVEIKNFTKSVNNVNVAVWSKKNDQDDLVWENAKKDENGVYYLDVFLKDHKFDECDYYIHVYYNNNNGWIGAITKEDVTVNKGSFAPPVKVGNDKITISLNGSDYSQDKTVEFAVWSSEGGQDDLRWYKADNRDGNLSYTIPLKNHKTKGKYNVHVYGHDNKGNPIFLTWTNFDVNPPKVEHSNVETPVFNPETNTFTVSVKNIESETGISRVQIPVWSKKNGQDDIVWYDAHYDNADNSWKVDVNIGDHSGEKDTYYAHIYVTTEIGIFECIDGVSVDVEPKKALIANADPSGKNFTISYANYKKYSSGTLKVAVWSDKNDQDDLEWYTLKNGKYEGVFSDHLGKDGIVDPGKYAVHLYIYDKNGKFLKFDSTSFEVLNPQTTTFTTTDVVNGKFKVLIDNVSSKFNRIEVPVWSEKNDQDDIVWYKAKKVKTGSYEVDVDIKNHKFSEGKYFVQAYMYGENGKFSFLHTTKDITINKGEIKPEDIINDRDTNIQVSISDSDFYGYKVKFKVWPEKDEKNGVFWYNAESKDGKITSNISINNHKRVGKYIVKAYVYDDKGNSYFITESSFDISDITFDATIEEDSIDATGSRDDNVVYRVKISNINSVSGVKNVRVPVWSKNDQSDIKWYDAVYHPEDNTYTVDVKPDNHKYNNGLYHTHAYVIGENGAEKGFPIQRDVTINLIPKILNNTIVNTGDKGKWRIRIINTPDNIKNITVPTWSDNGGQDDLVWYNAKKQGDGSWVADVKAVAHYPHGKMYTDVYVYYKDGTEKKLPYLSEHPYQMQNSYTIQPTYYSQHNGPWGGAWFGRWQMGPTGCVPTSLAMALNPIVGNIDPFTTASYLYNETNSFNKFYAGAGGNAFPTTTSHFGSDYRGLNSPDQIRQALRGGAVVIALVGQGHFVGNADTTHAIVLYGLNGDTPNIYDPYTLGKNRPWFVNNVSIDTLWNERSTNHWDNESGAVFHEIF